MKKKKLLLTAIMALFCSLASAQSPYVIYPIPHLQQQVEGSASFTADVDVIAETGIDQVTRERLTEILSSKGITAHFTSEVSEGRAAVWLGINGSGEAADLKATDFSLQRTLFSNSKFDRHIVALHESEGLAQLVVLGENTDAVFYGLASIEQILDEAGKENLSCVNIYDYADIRERGVVEGYYGVPYSAEVTKDLFRFMARYKLNNYMYGAKSDPYHSQYWNSPYPETITKEQEEIGYLTQDMLRDIASESHRNKVNFIWAIHPGSSFTNSSNTTVVSNIMQKFQNMYDLGVRQFGVFVDDVGVPTDAATLKLNADRITEIQNKIDEKWNTEGALPADTVKPLFFVPQLYVLSWSSVEGCRNFFGALSAVPSKVKIFITGNAVWSVPNSTDLATAKSYLGRNLAWWWNYPCNDNDVTKIFPMDTYSNFADEKHIDSNARLEQNLQGTETLLSNPMQQGEVSKIPLFSIADYAWNNNRFNNISSWEASLQAVCGKEYAPHLKKLAPYLRYFDTGELASLISAYKQSPTSSEARTALHEEITSLLTASQQVMQMKDSQDKSLQLFYADIAPWLTSLNSMLRAADGFMKAANPEDEVSTRWETYLSSLQLLKSIPTDAEHQFKILSGLGSAISLSVQTAEPAAKTLLPFVKWQSENALRDIFTISSTKATFITNSPSLSYNPITSSTGAVYISASRPLTLKGGEYLGLALPSATKLADIIVSDTLAANNAIFYSPNGRQWIPLLEGEPLQEYIKYVVIANATSELHALKLNRNVFCLQMPTKPQVTTGTVPSANSFYDGHVASKFYDGDYNTWTCIERNQQEGDAYTLQLADMTPIYDVRVCMGTVNDDYMTIGRVQISSDGTQWTNLTVKGTNITNYRLSMEQNVKWSDEMTYCDFDGKGKEAKYVRLYLYTPNTNKWLRLYEIEVNGLHLQQQFISKCTLVNDQSLPELTDGNPSTTADSEPGNSAIVYRFMSLQKPTHLELFTTASAQNPIYIEQTSDGGQSWRALATQTTPYLSIDLRDYPNIERLHFIPFTSQLPSIYEVKETSTDTAMPDVTFLPPSSLQSSDRQFGISGGTLLFGADVLSYEIFTADGKTIATSGRRQATLPRRGIYIVRTTTKDGKHQTSKVIM